jgi:hypothetical protein
MLPLCRLAVLITLVGINWLVALIGSGALRFWRDDLLGALVMVAFAAETGNLPAVYFRNAGGPLRRTEQSSSASGAHRLVSDPTINNKPD